MNSFYKTAAKWSDKIALAALLLIGLIIAHFIVSGHSAVNFSEPVELDFMGTAVSLPAGNGWQNEPQWKFEQNDYSISSFFKAELPNPLIIVNCRYLLAEVDAEPQKQIEKKARQISGKITEKGVLQADDVEFSWACIEQENEKVKQPPAFFASTVLPNGRVLNIEVRYAQGGRDLGWKIFEKTVKKVTIKDTPFYDNGIELVTKIKKDGVNKFLPELQSRSYFVVADVQGRPLGYTIDIKADLGSQVRMPIHAASNLYLQGRRGREQVVIFQSDNNLSEFIWKNENVNRFGRSASEGVYDKTGVLAVKEYGVFVSDNFRGDTDSFEQSFYRPGPAAFPDNLSDLAYDSMLDSSYDKILLDVIRPDGLIIPVLISKMEVENDKTDNIAYALRVDFLDGRKTYLQVYFNNQKEILREIVRDSETFVLQQATAEQLLEIFPDKSGQILQSQNQ